MAASKPTLSREYLYVPMTGMNFAIADLTMSNVAFTAAGIEPAEIDWQTGIPVDSAHALYVPSFGEAIVILVGPARGDTVDTFDLDAGDHQAWVEVQVTGSDERVVRPAGIVTVSATG